MDQDFEQIVQEHQRMLYKVCRVYTHNAYEYQELFQEVLIQLWKSLRNFKGESKLSTWIYRVAVNTALSFRAKAKRKKHFEVLEGKEIPYNPYNDEKDEAVNKLYEAIAKLKPMDKALITLQLEGNSYDEIAEITGLSKTNVGVRINRAKKDLVQLMQK